MRWRLTPRDTTFFDLLAGAAGHLVEGAALLEQIVRVEPAERVALADRMRQVEHVADGATHEIMRRLNSTFVTPFDRADIYALASSLDDCIDDMDAAADLIVLYRLNGLPDGVRQQVEILGKQARGTADAMPKLRSMKGLDEYWVEINRLENEADRVYRTMLVDLFQEGADPIFLLQVKEVIDLLESAADAFETVAHHVETIAVKES
jgi:predicted phosphate transport protein (TIGR00153 family)